MANLELWIQLENRPWDTVPNNVDYNRATKLQLFYLLFSMRLNAIDETIWAL